MSIAQRNGVNVIVGGSNRRVEVFRLHASGLPVVEGIMQAASKRLVVASNRIMDAVLSGVEWSSPYIRGVFPCWTGTMTGYNNAGAKLGKEIVYTDSQTSERWIFPVPEQFRGERGSILVVEHPDFTIVLDGTKDIRVEPSDVNKVSVVSEFPASDGWYPVDPQHGIPTGGQVNFSFSNPVNRYLWRLAEGRVGPVGRGYGYRRDVGLYNVRPSFCFGVAVESPAE